MKTFEVRNGDLVVGPKGHALVESERKTRQDLGIAMREPYGCDRFHPVWGSLLPRFVGEPVGDETAALIRAEATRLVKNIVTAQQMQLDADARSKKRPQLTTNEIITDVQGVDVRQEYDRYHVRVRLTTAAKSQVSQTLTVES